MEFIYHHRTVGRGAEGVHIASLVRALEEGGHTVTVVSPPGIDPLGTAGTVPVDKGNTQVRGVQRIWKWISRRSPQILFELLELGYNLYAAFRLIPVLRRRPSAVYYERYAFFLFMGVWLAKRYGRRVLLEVNEVAGIQRARRQMLVPLARWLERKTFERADAILTVSSFLKQQALRCGAREGTVYIVPNAVDPKLFPINGSGESLRKELGLDGATVVGFVGWFEQWDRLDVLIDAVEELRRSHPVLRLLLVGDGPVTAILRERIKQNRMEKIAILTGPVPRRQVSRYIDAMDICVLPDSNLFGSPIVLFEFMAMGKAIVAPDLDPIRDVLKDNATGLIIKPGDRISLKKAIARLLNDDSLRVNLGTQARKQVMEQHTWEANGKRVLAIVKELSVISVESK